MLRRSPVDFIGRLESVIIPLTPALLRRCERTPVRLTVGTLVGPSSVLLNNRVTAPIWTRKTEDARRDTGGATTRRRFDPLYEVACGLGPATCWVAPLFIVAPAFRFAVLSAPASATAERHPTRHKIRLIIAIDTRTDPPKRTTASTRYSLFRPNLAAAGDDDQWQSLIACWEPTATVS